MFEDKRKACQTDFLCRLAPAYGLYSGGPELAVGGSFALQ
jgi:hypothetical protein